MTKKALLLLSTTFGVLLSVQPYVAQQSTTTPHAPQTAASAAAATAAAAPRAQAAPSAQTAPQSPAPTTAPRAEAFTFFLDGNSYLGVQTEEINRDNMSRYALSEARGVGVVRVLKDSPAERAGLREGDVILRYNGEEVSSVRKLRRLISETAPDHTARLTISRGGSEQEISATMVKREFNFPRMESLKFPDAGELRERLEKIRPEIEGMTTTIFSPSRRIGVTTTTLTKQLADFLGVEQGTGLLVTSVNENTPAARAGLKAGDTITEVDGTRVENVRDFLRAVGSKKEGDVTLTVVRDKRSRAVRVTPERMTGALELWPGEIEVTPEPEVYVAPPKVQTLPRVAPRVTAQPLLFQTGDDIL